MKIIFFDYWLKGVNNFIRIAPIIKELEPESELKMIHTSSWQEKTQDLIIDHGFFKSYDIDYFHKNTLYSLLKKEKPDIIITLNNYFLIDKAINIFCRNLGIKIVYLSHGRLGSKNLSFSLPSSKRSIKKIPKINKMNWNMLLNYFYATVMEGKPMRFFKAVFYLAFKPMKVLTHSVYNEELKTDINLVYYKSCRDVLIEERGFPKEEIKIVGNPELDDFVLSPSMNSDDFFYKTNYAPNSYVLYMEDGTIQSEILTTEEWKKHISELNSILKAQNLKLIIKFHPRTDIKKLKKFIDHEEIAVITSNNDIKNWILYSKAIISLYSTTITFALYLRKTVFSPRWGVTKNIGFNYPESDIQYIHSASDFAKALSKADYGLNESSFYRENKETFDGKVLYRIAKEIFRTVK